MRLVLDTNVLVSAFLWKGTPGRLVELATEKEITLHTSRALVDELSEVLHRRSSPSRSRQPGMRPRRSYATSATWRMP